ncbi:membrane-associated protein, putative [Bodo saltans]|uniref:Membrane-associated protein, putative n=1 Tax=Bodo saltans TaxID=75058 RepID=A0A0S4ILB2_BODSA|nr:membrane-associated protein, putative [Bodo saltans]|eukprot:CUE71036.1 membrane-associated protein, putative [Bodo saltans]
MLLLSRSQHNQQQRVSFVCLSITIIGALLITQAAGQVCTNMKDCFDNSQNSDILFVNGSCQCAPCTNSWYGNQCQYCPVQYDEFEDCGACNTVDLYVGTYPNCYSNVCNISAVCDVANTRAVSGTVSTGCICLCRNAWSGSTCDVCPAGFNSSNACGSCLPDWYGYPTCSPLCTNAGNCTNHALTVSGTYASGCVCNCNHNWTTPNCSVCPLGYSAENDCATCAAGYQGYPHCDKSCTAADCSNHSLSVSGTVTSGCVCYCANSWYGKTCASCPYGMNVSTGCDRCVDGFSGFPNCSLTCTEAANCSSHATTVSGTTLTGCSCSCRNRWSTGNCSVCPYGYSADGDCGVCIAGWQGYPTCQRTCTVEEDCDNHASTVTGVAGQCACTCRNYWTLASNCSVCALPYAGSDCNDCAVGYTGYPNCIKNCTVQTDCSNHATTVQGYANGTCACQCRYGWTGSTCASCPVRYNASLDCGFCADSYEGTYPNCTLKCTVAANCTNHAVLVNGNSTSGCFCQCRNQWYGGTCSNCNSIFNASADCGTCAAAYENYPNCYLKCTIAANCSSHATNVSGNIVDGCNCSCQNQWSGGNCATCASVFDSSKNCGACAAGYDTYPHCYRTCTVASNCSGHATNVTGNRNTGCNCSCSAQWTNDTCGYCPPLFNASQNCAACIDGYGGYPQCTPLCTVTDDCSGNANTVSGLRGACVCVCRNRWSSGNCSVCPALYNATQDCGACNSIYETYPQCYLKCTNAANCSSHAAFVSGNTFTKCVCNCSDKWTGNTCASCPSNYNQSTCNSCAAGFSDYPTCPRVCTIPQDCSNNAINVSGLTPNCVCDCRNSWSGGSCSTCAAQYNSTEDCGTCSNAYAAFSTYPNCYLTCTVAANCSNHADSVTGNSVAGCNCSCRNQWKGNTCNSCAANYSATADCGTCAPGYIDYPICPRACTVALDCNGHASNVTGHEGSCVCNCTNQWYGDTCNSCPPHIDATKNCATCLAAYNTYPQCYLTCTTVSNCSNHATGVIGNTNTGCNCTCRNEWYGDVCNQCPQYVNATRDCGACVAGYDGYPNCRRTCTNALDCNSHAAAVSGLLPDCKCNCSTQWTSSTCAVCPYNFNSTMDCGTCANGFDSYPACYQTCTNAGNCSNHAATVSGNTLTGCACHCRNQWKEDNCSSCAFNFNASQDCGVCAIGYDAYPNCDRICTATTDCSGHSSNVTGLYPNCNCTCRNQWSGGSCSVCPTRYNASNDCAGCAAGYDGAYPACYLTCTREANCSGNAATVTGNTHTGCNCSCRNQWNGTTCDSCASIYSSTQDCGTCAEGYGFYPNCTRICSTVYECNAHATTVDGTYPNCTCNCRNQWLGSSCAFCPSKYSNTTANDCGTCTSDREGYPICVEKCTNAWNCSNNAQTVLGNFTSGCSCICRNQWSGLNCSSCPVNFDSTLDCGACSKGYSNYPTCAPLCTPVDCYNHSIAFSGTRPNCQCTCRNKWSLSNCSVCPSNYVANETSDCAACAPGYVEYPSCYRQCTVSQDCNSHAVNVTGNTFTGCNCSCRNEWSGSSCQVCAAKYNATEDCATCAVGYANDYPNCTRICTVDEDCNGHAVNATGLVPYCTCHCRNEWLGATCNLCPPKYDSVQDCGACDKYRADDYPNCSATSQSRPTFSMLVTVTPSLSENITTPTMTLNATHSGTLSQSKSFPSVSHSITPGTRPPTPAPPNTTHAQNATTTTAAPATTTVIPNTTTTAVPTTTTTTTPPTTTTTAAPTTTTTAAPTPVPPSSCTSDYCNNHSTSSSVSTETGQCVCECRNFWSGDTCAVCPVQYNATLDCATCASGRYNYPSCDDVQHVVANVTLNCSWSTYIGNDGGAGSLAAIAADVRDWLVSTNGGGCLDRVRGNLSRQLVVVAFGAHGPPATPEGTAVVLVDIQLFSPSVTNASYAALCLSSYVLGKYVSLDRTQALIAGSTPAPSANTDNSGDSNGDACFIGWIGNAVSSSSSPCGEFLCAPVLALLPAVAGSSFPIIAVIIPIVVLILIVLAVLLYKGKIGTLAYRTRRAQHYVDSGKYTLEFLHAGDEDVLFYSKRRATVIEASSEMQEQNRSRAPSRRRSVFEKIVDAVTGNNGSGTTASTKEQDLEYPPSLEMSGNLQSAPRAAPDAAPMHAEVDEFDFDASKPSASNAPVYANNASAPPPARKPVHDFSDI